MRITISGYGQDEDDKLVHYMLQAENDTFKGTLEFFEYAHIFKEFAEKLIDFPFTSKVPVRFEADNLEITVSLLDAVGLIGFAIYIKDYDGNTASFTDKTVETEMLHKLAALLQKTDFTQPTELSWKAIA